MADAFNYWVFNTSQTDEVISADGKSAEITVHSAEPRLSFAERDPYVSLNKDNEQYLFQYYGNITNEVKVERLELTKDLIKRNPKLKSNARSKKKFIYFHHINVSINKVFTREPLLEDMAFSLLSVTSYTRPQQQFFKQYRSIPAADYETIIKDLIYVTRTAFGKIANALPRENKLEFAWQAMDYFSTIDFKNQNLLLGLKFLAEYVHNNIISQGAFLVATDNMLRNEFSDELDADKIQLLENDSLTPTRIAPQAELFRHLISLDKQATFIRQIQRTIDENASVERRFQNLFENITWPLDLNV